MSSVATLGAVEFFFQKHKGSHGEEIRPYYILNQFEESISLHRDIQDALRKQLGDRLLPFCLHRSVAISEALAEGMTVVDYAKQSQPANDIRFLAQWLSETAPLQPLGHQAVRWSEQE
jgi:cellulose biosynthesis protein BcsQ